jgi:thiamine biosynthesis lipoprotein ApbE
MTPTHRAAVTIVNALPLVAVLAILLVDRHAHSVRFARPGAEIDLGGIAKGFVVEVAASVLRGSA